MNNEMNEDWIGRAVSVECNNKLGVFQGIIKDIDSTYITIVRAFRNGVPLRKQEAEITLRSCDIKNIIFIQAYNGPMSVTPSVINKPTPVKQPNFLSLNTLEHIEQQQQQQQQHYHEAPSKADMNAFLQGNRNGWGFGIPQLPQPLLPPPLPNLALTSPLTQRDRNKSMASPTTPIKLNNNNNNSNSNTGAVSKLGGAGGLATKPAGNVSQFFNNMIPPKVELRLGATFLEATPSVATSAASTNGDAHNSHSQTAGPPINGTTGTKPRSKSLSCNGNADSVVAGGYTKGHKKRQQQQQHQHQQHGLRRENSCRENQTFGTSVDDPIMHEDFDFEGNLALFNKQAIWQRIDQSKMQLQRSGSASGGNGGPIDGDGRGKYRHDENILEGQPLELRQIHTIFESTTEFVTDEGLIIPSIPTFVRCKIEMLAEKGGLSLQRQIDVLARGATDLAIMLLGGARRLTPNNSHQWPTIVIVCNQSKDMRASLIGATTGRLLSSHGLRVVLYLEEQECAEKRSVEIALYRATGNQIAHTVAELPRPDLVILSTTTSVFQDNVRNWINENRASILGIDTPPAGVNGISIKYSILPMLPLNGIAPHKCGKLYLCNPGIPATHYSDAGIKYKSPFGHKFVIPIHAKD